MKMYVIRVNGLLHHVTSHEKQHHAYAAGLIREGHDVTTEERVSNYAHDAQQARATLRASEGEY